MSRAAYIGVAPMLHLVADPTRLPCGDPEFEPVRHGGPCRVDRSGAALLLRRCTRGRCGDATQNSIVESIV
jgi:hypothetical protein